MAVSPKELYKSKGEDVDESMVASLEAAIDKALREANYAANTTIEFTFRQLLDVHDTVRPNGATRKELGDRFREAGWSHKLFVGETAISFTFPAFRGT